MATSKNSEKAENQAPRSGIVVFQEVPDPDNSGGSSYQLIDVSEVVSSIFNQDSKTLSGKNITTLLPELDTSLQELFSRILSLKTNGEIEYFSSHTSNWYNVAVQFSNKHLYLSFHDITNSKTADYSLETFFDFNLEMFSIFDKYGKCIRVNNEWENVLGYSFEELNEHSYSDLIHPDDQKYTMEVVGTFANNQRIFDFTNRLKTKDGTYKYIEWRSCFVNGLLYSSSRDITELKLHEEEIENQQNLRQIVERLDGVFFLVNSDMSNLLYITPNFNEIFGEGNFDGSDYLSSVQKVIHRDDLPGFKESFSNYRSTGVFREELRIWKSKEECIWLHISIFQIYNQNGKVIRHAGFAQDITKRKTAEIAENESKKQLDVIINTIPDVLITYNSKGEYLTLITSHPQNRIFQHQDVSGNHISDFFSKEITQLFMHNINVCLKKNAMQTIIFNYEKDGKIRFFENRFSPIDNDRVLSVVRDVTELVHAHQKLTFQLGLQNVLIQISNKLLSSDEADFENVTNDAIAELGNCLNGDRFYIYSYDDITKTISSTHEWCAEGIVPIKQVSQQVSILPFEKWIESHKDGRLHTIDDISKMDATDVLKSMLQAQGIKSMVAVPLIHHGTYVGFVGIDFIKKPNKLKEDELQLLQIFAQNLLSKRDKINDQHVLKRALLKAKETDRLKSVFLATLSHELRTPLNHIIGFSELLRDQVEDLSLKDYAMQINKSGQHLNSMIEEMLLLSFSTDVNLPVRKKPVNGVDIYLAVKSTLEELLAFFGKEGSISGKVDVSTEVMSGVFHIDRHKTYQILTKLVSNAIKFTNQGQVLVTIKKDTNWLNFSVEDTGIGISAEHIDIIFDAFKQLDEGYSRNYEGLGIGLSVAKKIADSVGATLTVTSTVGEGSCFNLSIPLEK